MPLCVSELWTGSQGWGYIDVLREVYFGSALRLKMERLYGDEGLCNLGDNPGVKLIRLDDMGNEVKDRSPEFLAWADILESIKISNISLFLGDIIRWYF